jgi:hypothetical protein
MSGDWAGNGFCRVDQQRTDLGRVRAHGGALRRRGGDRRCVLARRAAPVRQGAGGAAGIDGRLPARPARLHPGLHLLDGRRPLLRAQGAGPAGSNAIGTTYLRAGLLPPKEGLEIRRLLREYTALRVSVSKQNAEEVRTVGSDPRPPVGADEAGRGRSDGLEIRSLFIASLNETIDLHQSRKTVGIQYRIPSTIWVVLFLLITLSMLASATRSACRGCGDCAARRCWRWRFHW